MTSKKLHVGAYGNLGHLDTDMNSLSERIASARADRTHLFAVGQAGFIVKSRGGRLLGIDLYLSDCVERLEGHQGFKRLQPAPLMAADLVFDAIVATHPHWDHFDVDALPEMMCHEHTQLFASEGCAKFVRQTGIDEARVHYVSPGDIFPCKDFELHFTHCDHGEGAPDAVGILLRVDGHIILEAGDTALRADWVAEYRQLGVPDVMIAPINGKYGNMNAAECAQLASLIAPRLTIPCHYGLCASHGGDPGAFYELMCTKYPQVPVLLMGMGEHLTLE